MAKFGKSVVKKSQKSDVRQWVLALGKEGHFTYGWLLQGETKITEEEHSALCNIDLDKRHAALEKMRAE